jgi:hypothetical protein
LTGARRGAYCRRMDDRAQYEDLARGLFAAWTAHRLHNKSIDNVLKRYAPPDGEPIGAIWIEIAKKVDQYAREHVANLLEPPTPPTTLSE